MRYLLITFLFVLSAVDADAQPQAPISWKPIRLLGKVPDGSVNLLQIAAPMGTTIQKIMVER